MKVTLKIMGPAKRKIKENPSTIEIPDNSRVLDMMTGIGYSEVETRHLTYVREGITIKPTAPLCDGDFVQAVLQMGGG